MSGISALSALGRKDLAILCVFYIWFACFRITQFRSFLVDETEHGAEKYRELPRVND